MGHMLVFELPVKHVSVQTSQYRSGDDEVMGRSMTTRHYGTVVGGRAHDVSMVAEFDRKAKDFRLVLVLRPEWRLMDAFRMNGANSPLREVVETGLNAEQAVAALAAFEKKSAAVPMPVEKEALMLDTHYSYFKRIEPPLPVPPPAFVSKAAAIESLKPPRP